MDSQIIRQSILLNTHPDFKSADKRIRDANGINECLFNALYYQNEYDLRMTTPGEKHLWDKDELQKFEINLELIDRLYFIYSRDMVNDKIYEMICRMHYKGKPLYIEFHAYHHMKFNPLYQPNHFRCRCNNCKNIRCGKIFISRDVKLFMRLVLKTHYDNEILIYNSLKEDGIEIEDQWQYNDYWRYFPFKEKKIPTLEYICHEFICKNKQKLESQFVQLPKIIANSVEDFIRVDMAIDEYDRFNNLDMPIDNL